MIPASRGFNRFSSQQSGQSKINSVGERFPINRTLMEVIKGLDGASTEMVERSKTIFFPGDPAERVYLIRRGAVRLSRVYESGDCLLYTSPSPRDYAAARMPSSA